MERSDRRWARVVVVLAAAAALLVGPGVAGADAALLPSCSASSWPMFGHDPGRSFDSPDTCLTRLAAATLVPAWYFDTRSPVTAQPVVADGTLYVGAFDGRFHALDADTTRAVGVERWVFDTRDCSHACDNEVVDFGAIPASAAVATAGGRHVVVFGAGGTIFVLDAATGSPVASQCLDAEDPTCQGRSGHTYEIESSPLVVPTEGGVEIVVGTDVNEHDPAGPAGVIALDLTDDLRLVPRWQYDPATQRTTAGLTAFDPDHPDRGGCADVWSSPTLVGGTVVFGTGNCQPDGQSEGEATTALDLATGALRWSTGQVNEGLDLDRGATPNALGGGAVGEGGKDGWYYVYDGAGHALSATQVATGSEIGGLIGSTALGSVVVGGARHRVVFAASAIPLSANDPAGSLQHDLTHPGQALGVHALDLDAAGGPAVLWDALAGPAYGAATVAGDVVLVPDTFTATLLVLDAATGVVLRAIPTGLPSASPAAVVGRRVYMGAGITEAGLPGLSSLGGVWAFRPIG